MKSDVAITIGRNERNDIILKEPSISGNHALFYRLNNEYVLEDLNSTNGTYKNGTKILKDSFTEKDSLMFGDLVVSEEVMSKLFTLLRHKENNYTTEFAKVLNDHKAFENQKIKINKNLTGLLTKSFITLGIIGIVSVIPNVDPTFRLIGISVISPLIFVFADKSPEDKAKQLDLLKLEYEEKLKCPKCKMSLMNSSSTYWEGKTQCPNESCKAIWRQ